MPDSVPGPTGALAMRYGLGACCVTMYGAAGVGSNIEIGGFSALRSVTLARWRGSKGFTPMMRLPVICVVGMRFSEIL